MADYGAQDTSTTTLGANQFPISEVWTPNSGFSATEGGTQSTDGGGKKSAPVSISTKDGSNVTQGAKNDPAATDNTSSWSMIALLKGIVGKLLTSIAVTQSGTWTVQPGNTANTTAWKVDNSGVTQPVSGSVSVSNFPGTQPVSGTVTANQGGTWTVQPGNTANTTAWKVDGSAVTQPVSGTFWQATQPVNGTVTANPGAATTGGSTPYHAISTANTNDTNVKNSAGTLYGLSVSNSNAAARFFKLYNKATTPTVGTDTPVRTIQLPASSTVITAFPVGLAFTSGLGYGCTTGIANNDTGAVGTDISIDLDYK